MPASTATVVWVNERDLTADFGFVIEQPTGFTDAIAETWETAAVPGRYGLVPTTPEPTSQPRDLVLIGHMQQQAGLTLAASYDALKAWCSSGMVEIRCGLADDRVFHGWLQTGTGNPYAPMLLSEWGSLTLAFRCKDPLAYDRYDRVIGFGSTAVGLPAGTGPLSGVIRIKGPTTSPLTITKRNHAGIPTATLTLGSTAAPFTLGANDRVEIDSERGTIQRYTAGVLTDAISFLAIGSTFPLVIGRDEFDPDGEAWATLEVSSGLSTGAAEWIGVRTWV